MAAFGKPSHAIVLLPAGATGRAALPADRRRLAKTRLQPVDLDAEPLNQVLSLLDLPTAGEGLAALRCWGQTDERPDRWLCGADPVYLEARLDHLWLHAVTDLGDAGLAALLDYLRARLTADSRDAFFAIGGCGYFSGNPLASAAVSVATADGKAPDVFLPQGSPAATHDRLQSEMQMCLHDAELNLVRERAGRLPVNALWLWGGGRLPDAAARPLPPLFGEDPLFRGYWLNAGGVAAAWPGRLEDCATAARQGFVAVMPACSDADRGLGSSLRAARRLFRPGIRRVTLVCRDGFAAELRRGDRLRFWRRARPLPGEPARQ